MATAWLLWVFLIALVVGQAGSSETEKRKGFLLPIVRGFANNQVLGLKETLALGLLLNRTVILTGIIENTAEQQPGDDPRVIPFNQIFDPTAIKATHSVAFIDELQESGWKGQVDLVAFFYGKGSDELWLRRWQQAFKIPVENVTRKNYIVPSPFRCTQDNLTTLAADFEGHEVVAIFSYLGVVHRPPGHEWGNDSPDGRNTRGRPMTPCQQAYLEGTRALVKSPQVRLFAQAYIQETFGREPFVALHVRPFPDTCLKVWQAKVFDEQKANRSQICDSPGRHHLHEVLGVAVRKAMDVLHVERLFVMAHPCIRHHVNRILQAQGLRPNYISLEAVAGQGGQSPSGQQTARLFLLQASGRDVGTSASTRIVDGTAQRRLEEAHAGQVGAVSMLAMVEEEVAVRSKIFIATNGLSSMAGMVMQERHAHGEDPDTTLAFEQLGYMDPAAYPEPWSKARV